MGAATGLPALLRGLLGGKAVTTPGDLEAALAKGSTVELEAALVTLRANADAAENEVVTLTAEKDAVLVTADDDAGEKHDLAMRAALRRRDRAQLYIRRSETALAHALAADAEAARVALREVAEKEKAEAERALREVPGLCRGLLDVLAALAKAEAAVEASNADLPAGAEPLRGAEATARDFPGQPREEVRSKRVEAWTYDATGTRLSDETAARVRDVGGGRGYLNSPGSLSPNPVVKRPFTRREFRPAVPASYVPDLAADLRLPPLRAPAAAIWTPMRGRPSPAAVLAAVEAARASLDATGSRPVPAIETEFEPIREGEQS